MDIIATVDETGRALTIIIDDAGTGGHVAEIRLLPQDRRLAVAFDGPAVTATSPYWEADGGIVTLDGGQPVPFEVVDPHTGRGVLPDSDEPEEGEGSDDESEESGDPAAAGYFAALRAIGLA